jgi:hypothetical protein
MSSEQTPNIGTLRIDAETQRRIEEYACNAGVTPWEIVRRSFEEYEAAHNGSRIDGEGRETAFDVLVRAGLIGSVKACPGTPTDLSTNPEHLEGFGRD